MGWLGFDWVHFVAFYGVRFFYAFCGSLWDTVFIGCIFSFYGLRFFFQMHFVVLDGMYFLLDAICGDFLSWADYHQKTKGEKSKARKNLKAQ